MGNGSTIQERRRVARKPHHLPLIITLNSGAKHNGRKIAAVSLNTSSHGAFVRLALNHELEVGDSILLEIIDESPTPLVPNAFNITLKAKVVRVEPVGVAVEFQTM